MLGTSNGTNSDISGNYPASGDGIRDIDTPLPNDPPATPFGKGGAINNQGPGKLIVKDSSFTGNFAPDAGGGIFNTTTLTVTNGTFLGNRTDRHGGAIYNQFLGTVSVTNSTFSASVSTTLGGGIFNNGLFTFTNSTLAGNSALYGSAIYQGYAGYAATKMTLSNTIFANSLIGANCYINLGEVVDSGGNLRWPNTDESYVGTFGDPMLGELMNNGGPTDTIALQAGSAAIDAADAENCPPTDQRGVIRPQGLACDIGAFELDDPKQSIENPVEKVFEIGTLNQGQSNAFVAKLEAAIQQLDRGNDHAAINQMQGFINQVEAMIRSGTLSWDYGHPLIEAANEIIAVLSSNP